jgi:ferritin-like metal-binding protein YciE
MQQLIHEKGGRMALLDAKIQSPEELFAHKLGAALTMENTILEMLQKLEEEAQDAQLERNLRQHHQETQRHVQNLQRCFEALGEPIDEKPCPAIEGLEKEGKQMISQVSDDLVDSVILSGVIETEHHEIAVYDGLIIKAEAMGEDDVVALLTENLEQEDQTLNKAIKAAEQLAQKQATQSA